jgi:hypothetical protein
MSRFNIPQHNIEQEYRPVLVQRIISISTLWRLDTTGATMCAFTRGNGVTSRTDPIEESFETAFSESSASRLRVIDEDRGMTGVHVQCGGHPTDIQPIGTDPP